MNEQFLKQYEIKVFSFIVVYKKIVDAFINFFDLVIIHLIKGFEMVIFALISVMKATGKLMRYTTIPIHWIWIWNQLRVQRIDNIEDMPIFTLGPHYIYGKPGWGKSTCVYHAMMHYAYYTGKCSYTTAMMELPRKNIDGSEYYYHQLFEPSDFFKEGEQYASFDENFNIVVFEEMLTQFQQRNHANKSYKDELLPLVASMGTQRHQGIDLFFYISQLPRNDIAIMQMLAGYHTIRIKKVLDYKYWLDTGKLHFKVDGWKIKSEYVEPKGGGDYKLIPNKTWYYKNTYPEEMKFFNRLNMKNKYDAKPKAKGRVMNA